MTSRRMLKFLLFRRVQITLFRLGLEKKIISYYTRGEKEKERLKNDAIIP